MKVTYVGPYDEVEVASLGRTWTVTKGEPLDVPDDVGAGLIIQDTWEQSAGRKAAAKDEVQS